MIPTYIQISKLEKAGLNWKERERSKLPRKIISSILTTVAKLAFGLILLEFDDAIKEG